MANEQKSSLLQMAKGAIQERVDYFELALADLIEKGTVVVIR